jgi:DNA-binding NarL/FixJ family response regulator
LIRISLIAPSPALRAGLRALLSSDDEITIIDEGGDWGNTPQEKSETDVVVATSVSPASFRDDEAAASPLAAVLLLSDDPLNVRELTRSSSVWGILPLDASAEELCAAVRALSQGLIVGARSLLFASEQENPDHGPLTDRESEVLALLAKGLANKQIAVALGISEHTVKFHVSSIYSKLNVTNRTEAMREGLRGGWLVL